MRTAVVLFTRDLRVHDNPALAAAADEAERVLPLFVLDDEILRTSGALRRRAFLDESLRDLARSLGGLAIRHGDTVTETVRLARQLDAHVVHVAQDASAYARRRELGLREALEVRTHPSTSVVPLDGLPTSAGTAYRVFTPYWRAWSAARRRALAPTRRIELPDGVELGDLPPLAPRRPHWPGGETEARRRLASFLARGLDRYRLGQDDLAAEKTSGLSPYLHFGCLSPLELAERTASNERFVRQLCWRDFFLQLLAANPSLPRDDLRRSPIDSRDDADASAAWRTGQTGYPIVDAAMRQLAAEGWLHNRARLVVSSFLTKTLGLDWRQGAEHFANLLVDADLASNSGNWQWVAGTGTDTRPYRAFNPVRQALRYDPNGDYVRRYVPELAGIPGPAAHTPWTHGRTRYARPIVTPRPQRPARPPALPSRSGS
jgi:deoxyribodipyrimidine photolyase